MLEWIHELASWMVGLAETPVGPLALFGLAIAEASVFPIPPDLLLLGLDLIQPELGFVFAGICTVGSTVGGGIGYAIGRFGGRPVLARFISPEKIQTAQQAFHKYDVWAIVVAGFTPVPYKVFTIAAGVFHLNFWRFILASVCSRGARFFLVSALVFVFREEAKQMVEKHFNALTIGFVILLIGGFLVVRWASRRTRRV